MHHIPYFSAGIPCIIHVVSYMSVSHNPRADNDMDYHGYTECEWELLDRKGYKAAWLEKKLSENDRFAIDSKIDDYMDDLRDE